MDKIAKEKIEQSFEKKDFHSALESLSESLKASRLNRRLQRG